MLSCTSCLSLSTCAFYRALVSPNLTSSRMPAARMVWSTATAYHTLALKTLLAFKTFRLHQIMSLWVDDVIPPLLNFLTILSKFHLLCLSCVNLQLCSNTLLQVAIVCGTCPLCIQYDFVQLIFDDDCLRLPVTSWNVILYTNWLWVTSFDIWL